MMPENRNSTPFSPFDSAAEVLCDELRDIVTALSDSKKNTVQEIRLRSGKPLTLTDGTSSLFIDRNIFLTPSKGCAGIRYTAFRTR